MAQAVFHAVRLSPWDDLKGALEAFVEEKGIRAGFMASAVGSLRQATLRLADQDESTLFNEKMEIVSLSGTVSAGGIHLHVGLSRGDGTMVGGHLFDGCLVYTTAELVVGEIPALTFSREFDGATGYRELVVRPGNDGGDAPPIPTEPGRRGGS